MAELKCCPFCGGQAMTNSWADDYGGTHWEVFCMKCPGDLAAAFQSEEQAIVFWNRRYEPKEEIEFDYGAEV